MATDHCPHLQPPGCQSVSPTCGVHKVHQRRPTSSQPPLQGRHPRANRRTLIDPIPTVLSQVTAACPAFIASSGPSPPSSRSTDPVRTALAKRIVLVRRGSLKSVSQL